MTNPAAWVHSEPFGTLPAGGVVMRHTLGAGGLRMQVIDWGAIVSALWVPDARGMAANVVLGFDDLDSYLHRNPHFGAVVGRVANRIGEASFALDGRHYALSANDGANCLHGGASGFSRRLWRAEAPRLETDNAAAITLHLHSADGDQGFPGALDVAVTYRLGPGPQWRIEYTASCDAATVVNLSQHSYFNLAGGGSAMGQRLWLRASRYAPVDEALIPLPDAASVQGTPFDFRTPTAIDHGLREAHPQLLRARGYDHNFFLDRDGPGLQHVATLSDPTSGRTMEVLSTEPAIQFYSGNFLDGTLAGHLGRPARQGDGVCLETQHAPDSPRRDPSHPDWPSTALRPGQHYASTTVYRFGVAA